MNITEKYSAFLVEGYLNEGKKLKKWKYTGTIGMGDRNWIYFQIGDGADKYVVEVTPDEYEDYNNGGTLKDRLVQNLAKSGKAIHYTEHQKKNPPKGFAKYLMQGGRDWD